MSTATDSVNDHVKARLAARPLDEHASTGSLLIIGGGGHAAVVAEAARDAGWTVIGYLDDSTDGADAASLVKLEHHGATGDVVHALRLAYGTLNLHAAAGDAALREKWLEQGLVGAIEAELNIHAAPIIHPSALISPSATFGGGVFVGPIAVINARATIAPGAIINTGAIIEHDCAIGRYAHIAPGSILAGAVQVGDGAMVGAGATVLPGVKIGAGATIGANATVISDIPDGATAIGSPAKAQE